MTPTAKTRRTLRALGVHPAIEREPGFEHGELVRSEGGLWTTARVIQEAADTGARQAALRTPAPRWTTYEMPTGRWSEPNRQEWPRAADAHGRLFDIPQRAEDRFPALAAGGVPLVRDEHHGPRQWERIDRGPQYAKRLLAWSAFDEGGLLRQGLNGVGRPRADVRACVLVARPARGLEGYFFAPFCVGGGPVANVVNAGSTEARLARAADFGLVYGSNSTQLNTVMELDAIAQEMGALGINAREATDAWLAAHPTLAGWAAAGRVMHEAAQEAVQQSGFETNPERRRERRRWLGVPGVGADYAQLERRVVERRVCEWCRLPVVPGHESVHDDCAIVA